MRILKNVLLILIAIFATTFIVAYFFYQKINSVSLKSENGITSILILGKGGLGHSAPDLTDTIMLSTIDNSKKRLSFLSLPRDLWIESTKAKINSSYYWGKQKGGSNFDFVTDSVKEVTGIKPTYVVVVDFSIFKDLVDSVGGIDVNVDNAFIDNKYPIVGKENENCPNDIQRPISKKTYGCRYETLDVKAGVQHMDGEYALKFVRSRNSDGIEGTDLARERRQQKVITALKDRLLSPKIMFDPRVLKSLYAIVIGHIESNIDIQVMPKIALELFSLKNNIIYLSIPENMLKVSQGEKRYDNQYIFLPVSGSWESVQKWVYQMVIN